MKKSSFLICILLMLVATTLTYSNHFKNAFQFDDSHTIEDNTYIRDIHNLPLFFKDGSTLSTLPANQAYRPLVAASLAVDYWLGKGYNLFYFHLDIFLTYLLQGVLMVFFFKKILEKSTNSKAIPYVSLVAATWYMLHPAMAETVNYISARSDTQSTFFVVLGFVMYLYSNASRKFFLYLIPVCIGGLAKPTIVMFAPMLFFYVLFFEEGISLYQVFSKKHFKQTWATIKKTAPAFVACTFMYLFLNKMTPATWQPGGTSKWHYLITQPFVILHYFTTFFVPNELSADTDWQLITGLNSFKLLIGSLFILLMVVIAFFTSKKEISRPISFGILWYFLALVPTSSIVPLGEVLNDHRMFFPFIGLALSVTWCIGLVIMKLLPTIQKEMPCYRAVFTLAIVLVLSIYAYGTRERNKVWHTGESLWKDVTIKSPNNPRGQMNYGLSLMAKGDYNGAISYYQRALDKWPYYAYAYINMAIAKNQLGKVGDAEESFKKSIQYGSGIPDTYSYYANFLMTQGRNAEAALIIEKGLSVSPKHANLLMYKEQNAAAMKSSNISTTDKITALLETIKKSPTPENYIELSLQYYSTGAFEKCIEAAQVALKLRPNYDLAYNNICASYNKLKNWDKAIEAGENGLQVNPNNQLLRNNLEESKRNKAK